MWQLILNALIKELENNPDRILSIIEEIIGLLKANPAAVSELIKLIPKS